jgi:uncharacterized membrane protein YtjA (UPF0391 family)
MSCAPPGQLFRSNVAAGNPIQQGPIGADESLFRNGAASEPAAQPAIMSGELMGRHRRAPEVPEHAMTILKWALIFFLVSIVAGLLGFTGISAASADIARFLFYVFAVIFLVLLILGLTIFRA